MNDYKELIKNIKGDAAFRHILSECGADGCVWFDKRFICDYVSRLKYAIEQLCTDVARLEAENRAKEQYISETIGKLARERKRDDEIIASLQKELVEAAKERDAAIADFETFAKTAFDNPFACNFCKHEAVEYCTWKKQNRFDKDGCFGRYFEWRGARDKGGDE